MSFAAAILVVFATLVLCVEAFAFDAGFYKDEYGKHQIAYSVGVDEAVLYEATDVLLEYLKDDRKTLDFEAQIDGSEREYFNEREKAHMVDVKALYQNAIVFMAVAYIVGGVLFLFSYIVSRQAKIVLKAAFFGVIAGLAVFAVLGVWIAVDFNSFWTAFHHLMFSNDLWLLDAATSLLIRMYPGVFFFDLVSAILLLFIVIVAVAIVGLRLGYKKALKNERLAACKKEAAA
ncbi:MAG: TIGR01906 family membrane protein [Christensenellaceae bacterium]